MGGTTLSYQQPEPAGTYWRRRFIILAVGLVVFGLLAWGVSVALEVSPSPARPPAGHHDHRTGPAAGAPGSGPQSRSQSKSGSKRAVRSSASSHVASGSRPTGPSPAGPSPAGTSGQATGHGMILPAFCARSDIVLSLFTGQTAFGPGQWPAFDVNVVSTQVAECSFNIGSGHLAVLIKEGPALIWNSADCAAGASTLVAALRRGVPTVLAVSWNRQTSAPGCSTRHTKVPPGTYTAYAVDGQVTSQPVTFSIT
jgi:hypothetical protein